MLDVDVFVGVYSEIMIYVNNLRLVLDYWNDLGIMKFLL